MLTIAEIEQICDTHPELLSRAIFPGLPARRVLYLSEKVRQFITGAWPGMDIEMRGRWLTARAVLESFVDGKRITIKSRPKSRGEMSILCPHNDGIWEFRDVKPKPAVRILGSFSEKDVFIALAPYERNELGAKGSPEWAIALSNYKNQWIQLFDGHQPMVGGSYPHAYLSDARYLD